ncbi:hypothetical protein HZH68_006886 [Vespula germanica]|uniref:Uncharacterized protein n=2 Tax=Vespula TaxID=7451 RepID=A0A834K8D0_VESGE|nr:hypothetical protein HZH68_006886 [Vespula germanica]KAF7425386.1 hypothetical protein H0235_007824 [Vespula pensylvanica]
MHIGNAVSLPLAGLIHFPSEISVDGSAGFREEVHAATVHIRARSAITPALIGNRVSKASEQAYEGMSERGTNKHRTL